MRSGTQGNPALDNMAIYGRKRIEKSWVSFEDSRYCYWDGCLDESLPYGDDATPNIISGLRFVIRPRLVKSPLKGELHILLPRDAVMAIDYIYGEGAAFKIIANSYGHDFNGKVGTAHGHAYTCILKEIMRSLLFRKLQEIPMSKIEPLIDDMPSEIMHTLIEHSKLSKSHAQRLDAQHRDSLFSIDLGL